MSDDTRVTTPAPVATSAASAPVFVDPTGRRERVAHAAAWVLGGLVAGYLVLLVVSLVGPPGVLRFAVPGVGPIFPGAEAPRIATGSTSQRPAQVFRSHPASTAPVTARTAAPAPAPTPTRASVVAPVTGTPAAHPSGTGAPTATARATGSPTSTPTVRSSSRAPATGKPTARPSPTKGPR